LRAKVDGGLISPLIPNDKLQFFSTCFQPNFAAMSRIATVLLFVLIAPPSAAYLWLRLEQKSAARTVKHTLMKEGRLPGMIWLRFSRHQSAALSWKHAAEFELNDIMYDVADSALTPDSVFYFCYPDLRETHARKILAALTQKLINSNSEHQDRQTRFALFCSRLVPPPTSATLPGNLFKYITEKFVYPTPQTQSFFLIPPAPPPETC
jgi:hypothetical protein